MYLIMGYLNLMREEAGDMTRKGERKLLFVCMVFVFACLIFSGGWRLVAGYGEDDLIPVRVDASIRAMISAAPVRLFQPALFVRRDSGMQRMHAQPVPVNQVLNHSVSSDSNGNVLAAGTYMRAVYQAFVLDDGFV